jgi:predicted DNA-binding transcriptional regulator YafY
MKTSRVSRIIQILTALQSGQTYTVCDLATHLGVSRRTVFRDLQDLQRAGVPAHYDSKVGHYTIDSKFFFPPPDLTIQETLGLLLLVHKTRGLVRFPFMDSSLRAVLKIENHLSQKIKFFCNRVLEKISVKTHPMPNIRVSDKIFLQLIEAILKKRIVNIDYYLPKQCKNIVCDLSPYHLFYNDHMWYVLGKSDSHRQVCAFKLNRIRKLTILDRCFAEGEKFDLKEQLARAWSMVPEGKLYHVKLRFLPEVANDVAETQWHSTQTVSFEEDGSAIIEFRVDGLSEITWWILSYGDKVQVLRPRELRQKITQIAQNMVKQNEQLLPIQR